MHSFLFENLGVFICDFDMTKQVFSTFYLSKLLF